MVSYVDIAARSILPFSQLLHPFHHIAFNAAFVLLPLQLLLTRIPDAASSAIIIFAAC
jgi:hypothetical protein